MLFRVLTLSLLVLGCASAQAADDIVQGEVIVKMKGRPSGAKSASFVGKMQGKLALKATFGQLNMHHMKVAPGQTVDQVLEELRNDPDVEYAEPNYVLRMVEDGEMAGADFRRLSEDDMLEILASQNAAMGTYTQSNADTKVTESWSAMSSSSSEVPVVAIIDTGVDYNHTKFVQTGAIWVNPGEIPNNGIDDDGNGYIDDVRGWNFFSNNNNPMDDEDHGSHVAGIVLGVTQNLFPISPETLQPAKIRLMPLKFLGADGSGSTSAAISAVYYAVRNHAQVINNSWGGGSYSQALHEALTYAYSEGVVIATAAGNNSRNNDSYPMYPANYPVPSQLSVAATNDMDTIASFSNYGSSTVHVAAPGVGIYSTVPGNYYRYMNGTSMAAPFVAGLAALAVREAPNLSGYQIRNLILNSATSVTGLVPRVITGARVNGYSTVVNSKTQTGILSSQPNYTPVAPANERSPASEKAKAGCGMVSSTLLANSWKGDGGSNGPGSSSPMGMVVALTLLPLLVWQVIRMRANASPANRRRFERFVMNSEIKVRVGDRELVGQMNTISMGGASFKADAMLEKGGVVTLQIASPDGNQQLQVEGHIVWNEQNQAYGVQFADAKDSVLSSINTWTKGLVKAS